MKLDIYFFIPYHYHDITSSHSILSNLYPLLCMLYAVHTSSPYREIDTMPRGILSPGKNITMASEYQSVYKMLIIYKIEHFLHPLKLCLFMCKKISIEISHQQKYIHIHTQKRYTYSKLYFSYSTFCKRPSSFHLAFRSFGGEVQSKFILFPRY